MTDTSTAGKLSVEDSETFAARCREFLTEHAQPGPVSD